MRNPKDLLYRLGITYYTTKHLQIIDEFLSSEETDVTILLERLVGEWCYADVNIVNDWIYGL